MVVGNPLEGTSASGSMAILAGDMQVESSLIDVDKVVHVARTMEDVLSPLLSTLNALRIVVSLRLNPHEFECVSSELVDGPVNTMLS